MSDVSAVVLSMGEPFVGRALEALARQTMPVAEVVVVEHVSPFHRAINEGARRVNTPFFVQVDADMIPDATCVQELRAAMDDRTGATCGELRDPLMGQVVGIKLFRTELVRRYSVRDSIAQDVDFAQAIERAGWAFRYIGRPPADSGLPARTLGEHQPDYTPAYTFQKYLVEGRRYRYRGARGGLFWRLEELARLSHPMIPLAQVAQAHGFFLRGERDELKPVAADPRAEWLAGILASPGESPDAVRELFPLERYARLRDVFRVSVRAGRDLASAAAGASAMDVLATLQRRRHDWRALVAHLGVGHGILGGGANDAELRADERALRAFVRYGIGRRLPLHEHAMARARFLAERALPGRVKTPWIRSMPPW